MQRLFLTAILALAACEPAKPSATPQSDARDIAMVEGAQHAYPPVIPLVPQALPGDLARAGLAGPACTFSDPAYAANRPILATGPSRAAIRIAGSVVTFASDPGSSSVPLGTWNHYSGLRYSLLLEPLPTEAIPSPAAFSREVRQLVAVTIKDEHDRVVLQAQGVLTCGAAPPSA